MSDLHVVQDQLVDREQSNRLFPRETSWHSNTLSMKVELHSLMVPGVLPGRLGHRHGALVRRVTVGVRVNEPELSPHSSFH